MRFKCSTLFDITATGVTGHYKSARIPFFDQAGQHIENELAWNYSRNQQRNWETVVQVIGLRTQIFKLDLPVEQDKTWSFEFEVETPAVFGPAENPVEYLESDASGVPMLLDLRNKEDITPTLVVSGQDQNIWFTSI